MLEHYEPVIDIIEDIFGDYKSHNEYTGQISVCCPVCSYDIKGLDKLDGKYNLEINYKNEVYKCWSCSETNRTQGQLSWMIKKYGTTRQHKDYLLLRPENPEVLQREYKRVKLPKEFISFKDIKPSLKLTHFYKQSYKYLKSRNITDEMISKYNIGFCYQGEYENRIIIPSYDEEDEVNYFIARSILSKPKMKYKNPSAQKEIIIWNEHLIDWDKTVYLVEGVFDSIFLPNSIPMLGKVLHERLYKLIYERAKKVVILLDPDAWSNAVNLFHKINAGKLLGKVWVIKLEGDKDLADLSGDLTGYEEFQIN
jgi:hypothetical protein